MDELNKKVDESYKNKQDFAIPEPDFKFFATTLGIQAGIFLGQIPNPATNKQEQDLPQAKFIIDTLSMLELKTKGNLAADEAQLLENLLYELRMQYVSLTKGKNP